MSDTLFKRLRPSKLTKKQNFPTVYAICLNLGIRAVLHDSLDEFIFNLLKLLQTHDPEHVHQARIGWRKLRSLLRYLRPVLRTAPYRSDPTLKALQRALGCQRTLDVAMASAHPPELLATPRQKNHQKLQKLACSQATVLALNQLQQHIAHLRCDTRDFTAWAGKRMDQLNQQRKRYAEQASNDAHETHRLRLKSKEIRYILETFPFLLKAKRFSRLLKTVRKAQDQIGQKRDQEITRALLKELKASPPMRAML